MHFSMNLRPEARAIRQRLFYPPNAVPDRGINLRRRRELPAPPRPEPRPIMVVKEIEKPPMPDWLPAIIAIWQTLWATREPSGPAPIRIETIQNMVARYFNIKRGDLLSKRRHAEIVRPRQIAMYLAKVLTLRSFPEIGRRFGGRDHTTVLHAVRKIESLIENDGDLAADVAKLRASLS